MTFKSPQTSRKKPAYFYGYNVVIAAFLIMLLAYGIRTSFGVFFKPIEAEFAWSRALISGAATLSILIQGIWGIFMGRMCDKIGARIVMTVCCSFLGLGLLLVYFTQFSWQLYLFYGIIVGLGLGGVFVGLVSTVARWFVKRRGFMTGIVLAGIGAGTVIMSPVSNWLISLYGWRMSNVILGVGILVIGIIVSQFLRRDPSRMGLTPYGQAKNPDPELSSDARGLSLKETLNTHQFWMLTSVFCCLGYCTFIITIHLVPHITDLGISPSVAAVILAATGGVHIIAGIIFGMLADRIGNRKVMVICFIVISASLYWLISITSVPVLFLFAVVYSLGIGGVTAMESTIAAELFGLKSLGLICGMVSFGFTIGGAAGPLLTGYLFDQSGNYTLAFIISGSLGLTGLFLTSFLTPVKTVSNSK